MDDVDAHRPRYGEREVTDDAAIREFLHARPWGVLTTVDGDEPVPTPLHYVYDRDTHAIAAHVSPAGRTAAIARAGSAGAFAVATMGDLVRAPTACGFDTEYESVVARGSVELVEQPSDKRDALARLVAKYVPGEASEEGHREMTAEAIRETAVVCLQIADWSGKRNRAGADAETVAFDPDWRPAPN